MDIYLVGGAVRDKLLSLPVKDRDWVVVGADVETMLALGYQQVGKDFPVFIHPHSKEEYALARTERKTAPGHTGFELRASPDVTLEEDLQRRDLTINAMAEDQQGHVTDPWHGRDDLQQRILRHVSPAFAEDPLRVLRVARFAARFDYLGFTIADETLALMRDISRSGELQALPPERIWQETQLALSEQSPGIFFSTLAACEALTVIFPGLTPDRLNLAALAASTKLSESPAVRFAALCCELSLAEFLGLCQQLRTPNDVRDLGKLLLTYTASDLGNAFVDAPEQDTDQQAEKLLAILELTDALRRPQKLDDFLLLVEAVQLAQGKQDFSKDRSLLIKAMQLATSIKAEDIIEAGHEGAAIGQEMTQQRLQAISHYLTEHHGQSHE